MIFQLTLITRAAVSVLKFICFTLRVCCFRLLMYKSKHIFSLSMQFKEMGGGIRPSDTSKTAEQLAEKKKGFGDLMNLIKPGSEEKDHWVKPWL